MFSKTIFALAAVAAVTYAWSVPMLEYKHTGLGANVQISLDSGSHFLGVFSGELYVARCDISEPEFYGFCTNADVSMDMSQCWAADVVNTNSLSPAGAHVGRLAAQYAGAVHASANNVDAQMLQAAIWEMTSETSSAFDLTSGSFIVKNYDGSALSATQIATAQTYFNDLTPGVATWYRAQLNDAGAKLSQDIVTPVPEPGTIIALATGLIGLVLRPRRRA